MKLSVGLSLALINVLRCLAASSDSDFNVTAALRNHEHPRSELTLAAATTRTALVRRSDRLRLVHECDLDYSHNYNGQSGPSFAARVHLGSDNPILLLEENEHLLDDVDCSDGTIALSLSPGLDAKHTLSEIDRLLGGFVITSHPSCNAHGERMAYRVKSIVHTSATVSVLSTELVDHWQSTFSKFSLNLGHTHDEHILRPHRALRRRQVQPTNTVPTPFLPSLTLPAPTATSTETSHTFDLTNTITNKSLTLAPVPGVESTLTLSCQNCSTAGTLSITWLSFSISCDLAELTDSDLNVGDCLQGGQLSLTASDLHAHLELLTSLTLTQSFSYTLFTVPVLYAFKIPRIGTAGLMYAPALTGSITLDSIASLTTGFDFTLPSASLHIDLPNPSASNATGFSDLTLTPLPLHAEAALSALDINLALRHRIQFGILFDALPGSADNIALTTGVYLDVPAFSLGIEPRAAVDADCNPLASATDLTPQDRDLIAAALGNAYSLRPTTGFAVGLEAHMEVPALPLVPVEWEYGVANASLEGAPSCVNWESGGGVFVGAAEVVQEAKRERDGGGDASTQNVAGEGDREGGAGRVGEGLWGCWLGVVVAVAVGAWAL